MGEFDFWVGRWAVEWDVADGAERRRGRNLVTAELGGKVMLERFDGRPGTDLQGLSVTVHDGSEWRQTWVDNQEGYIDLRGGPDGEEMVLSCERGGAELRMRFSEIEPESFVWHWERREPGQDWNSVWRIDYRREA